MKRIVRELPVAGIKPGQGDAFFQFGGAIPETKDGYEDMVDSGWDSESHANTAPQRGRDCGTYLFIPERRSFRMNTTNYH